MNKKSTKLYDQLKRISKATQFIEKKSFINFFIKFFFAAWCRVDFTASLLELNYTSTHENGKCVH
jgi:hypothetical protein